MPQKRNEKHGTVFDYISWRGDLTFEQSPVNEVDGLIFSFLSYVDYAGFVPEKIIGEQTQPLLTVTRNFLRAHSGSRELPKIGLLFPKDIVKLLARSARSRRFGLVRPLCFVNKVCGSQEKQFCAVVFALENGDTVISFRGTDDNLVAWKENLNMSFIYPVPAQRDAVTFTEYVAKRTQGALYLCGHSKGGNLAAYAAVKSSPDVRARIKRVYSNDAPGFDAEFISGGDYREMIDKISTFVPQSSVVGMLLEHEERYTVVKSRSSGVLQHNGLLWEVMGSHFIHLDDVSEDSKMLDRNMKRFLSELDKGERERMIDAIFEAINTATGAKTLTELNADKLQIVKIWNSLDNEAREHLKRFLSYIVGMRDPTLAKSGFSRVNKKI